MYNIYIINHLARDGRAVRGGVGRSGDRAAGAGALRLGVDRVRAPELAHESADHTVESEAILKTKKKQVMVSSHI